MFECNAFNLNNFNLINESEHFGDLKPLDQIFVNLTYTQEDELYLTPPVSTHDLTKVMEQQQQQPNYSPPRRANRPYSYYIATNFHPLDLSVLSEKINEIHTETNEPCVQDTVKSAKVTRRNKKNKDLTKKSKRLSTSLGNLIDDQTNLNETSCTTQNTPINKKKLKSKSKDFVLVDDLGNDESNHFLNRRPGQLLYQSDTNHTSTKKPNLYSSTRRLNKFIRSIFHLDSETPNTMTKEPTIENNISNSDSNKFASKFSRFFSSFRPAQHHQSQTNTIKKRMFDTQPVELVVIEEQSNTNLMLPEIKLATPLSMPVTDDLNVSFKKELNYAEIEYRLKKLTATSYISGFSSKSDTTGYESASTETLSKKNEKSTSNISTPMSSPLSVLSSSFDSLNQAKSSSCFMDIPFIDEDLESNYELNIDYDVKTNLACASAASSSTSTNLDFNLITDQIIKEYLRDFSYDKLDTIVNDHFKCYKSEWLTIVLIFELTSKSIHVLNETADKSLISELKEMCAKYINDKYCDFVHQNGGWDSVPDSISLTQTEIKNRIDERIH